MRLASQETALTNAGKASTHLQKRRREREEVDAYLGALTSSSESLPSASDLRSKRTRDD